MRKVQTEINNSAIRNSNSALPPGWHWVRLGEVCNINPRRPKNFIRSPDTPTTFVPMAAVDEKTGTIARPEVVPYSKVSKGYTYFEENDVLFAKITPCMQNGKHVIARNLIDGLGFGTTEFHVIRPNNEILSEWIHFFIRQPYFLQQATAYFTGAVGQQRVPEDFLSNYIIPLPPVEEQQHIAAKIQELMQDVERARTACEKQLEAAKVLPAAYLREVFESEEAKRWERKNFKECIMRRKGLKIKGILQKNYQKTGVYPIVDQGHNLTCGYTDDQAKLYRGELPVIVFGDHTRIFKYIDFPFAIGADGTQIIQPNREIIMPKFFYFALLNLKIRSLGYSRHYKLLKEMSIPIPPLPIQHRIAAELKQKMAQVESLQSAIRNQQSALNSLPQAILRKAFKGEL